MTDRELKQLQHNLTRSAKKAKKYWVRGMIGFTESDQGFFPIGDIPISNPLQNKETPLSEVIQDSYSKQVKTDGVIETLDKQINARVEELEGTVKVLIETLDVLTEKYNNMESRYEEIIEKGIAEYIKMLGKL